jgi:hypothetical protein
MMFDPAQDYNDDDMDIMPLSDPAAVTKMQKLSKADFVLQTAAQYQANVPEALKRMYEAADVEDPEKLMPQPDPQVQELMQRGAVAEVEEKEGKAMKAKAEAMKIANEPAEGTQPAMDPVMGELEVAKKSHEVRGAELDNMNKEADLRAKDVEVGEDGTVESRTMLAVQAVLQQGQSILDGLNMLAQIVAQQGAQQTQAINQLAELVAAPNELVRDPVTQRAVGSRKVMPTLN